MICKTHAQEQPSSGLHLSVPLGPARHESLYSGLIDTVDAEAQEGATKAKRPERVGDQRGRVEAVDDNQKLLLIWNSLSFIMWLSRKRMFALYEVSGANHCGTKSFVPTVNGATEVVYWFFYQWTPEAFPSNCDNTKHSNSENSGLRSEIGKEY